MTIETKHPNYLFILANPGAGGHRLGRIISCLDNVYWYSAGRNGYSPWDVYAHDKVAGKSISEYHYDRYVGELQIPLVGERIEQYWNPEDVDMFYKDTWSKQIRHPEFMKIIGAQYLHWVLHDLPENLLKRFPNSKIISLIDNSVNTTVNRYLETTANFPMYIRHTGLMPQYKNHRRSKLEELHKKDNSATEQDFWLFLNPDSTEKDFTKWVKNKLNNDNLIRKQFKSSQYMTVSWEDLDIEQVKIFIGAKKVDENYKLLLG
jgi:hypothetical protein